MRLVRLRAPVPVVRRRAGVIARCGPATRSGWAAPAPGRVRETAELIAAPAHAEFAQLLGSRSFVSQRAVNPLAAYAGLRGWS